MRLKSYFADTIEAAMSAASRELGEDALLVYSREASAETKYLGTHEVVFAMPEREPGRHLPPQEPAPAVMPPALPPTVRSLGSEQVDWAASALAELRHEIGSLRQDVASHRRYVEDLLTVSDRRAWRLLADWGSEPELLPGVALAGKLLHADMDPEHVLDLVETARDAVREAGGESAAPDAWKQHLAQELMTRRRCDAGLSPSASNSAVLLIGPPGAGKTTVAMQLAANLTGRGIDPKLIAFEPGRLTASQTLKSYAAVLGSQFELARRGEHLATVLASREAGEYTIVDGPGLGISPDEASAQVSVFRNQFRSGEVWLVVPATLRTTDLKLLLERFSTYGPSRLIFTRTAEVRHWGAVWSAAEWAGLPIGFFCDGPRIPEDLRPASAEFISSRLLADAPAERRNRTRTLGAAARAGASERG